MYLKGPVKIILIIVFIVIAYLVIAFVWTSLSIEHLLAEETIVNEEPILSQKQKKYFT